MTAPTTWPLCVCCGRRAPAETKEHSADLDAVELALFNRLEAEQERGRELTARDRRFLSSVGLRFPPGQVGGVRIRRWREKLNTPKVGWGYRGIFCTLRCALTFAEAAHRAGYRIKRGG